ncbi:hypothetical protein SRHO_G00023050 [Serrasalmus rhombeus]
MCGEILFGKGTKLDFAEKVLKHISQKLRPFELYITLASCEFLLRQVAPSNCPVALEHSLKRQVAMTMLVLALVLA